MGQSLDRSEWLQKRKAGIGGSDIGAILGLSPYRSAVDVYLDKRGESEQQEESEPMYWGTVLEDVVATEYAKRTQHKIQRVNQLLRHPEHGYMMANIDRAIVNPAIAGAVRLKDGRLTTDRLLECKTANGFAAGDWGETGSDMVPASYLAQCQWYMGVTGALVCDLAVLIGGNDYRIYTMQRDGELIADMQTAAEAFWIRTIAGIAPDPASVQDAQRLWPGHMAGKKTIVDVWTSGAVATLKDIQAQIKALDVEADILKAQIMQAFGDAEEIAHMGKTLATWKTQTTKRLDTKRLQSSLPIIAAAYMKETDSRVLRIK